MFYVLGKRACVSATVIYSAALTNVTCEMESVLDAFLGHFLLIHLCLMTKPYAVQCTECKKNQHIYPTIFSIVYFTFLVSWHCSENPFMVFFLFKTWVLFLATTLFIQCIYNREAFGGSKTSAFKLFPVSCLQPRFLKHCLHKEILRIPS